MLQSMYKNAVKDGVVTLSHTMIIKITAATSHLRQRHQNMMIINLRNKFNNKLLKYIYILFAYNIYISKNIKIYILFGLNFDKFHILSDLNFSFHNRGK